MDSRIATSWERLTTRRDRILAEFTPWPDEQLRQRPAPEAWSVIEVIEHLLLTEKLTFAGVRKNRGAAIPITLRDRVRAGLVLGVMLLPTRVRIPKGVTALAPSHADQALSRFVEGWETERRQMREYLATLSGKDLTEGVFKHPVGGWVTVRGTLIFLESHLLHHGYQLRRIRKDIATD